jgi:signal transduction histidine kinase
MYRDVSTAIDAATSAGARFRFWMVIGVMTVVFGSLMMVVMRGHRAQTESRTKLQELLIHEHLLVSELDQRNADLKSADDARLQLLSVVTHELGNPLTSISAFISMLANNRDGNISEREMSIIEAISRGETQMRVLLKDLLDFSRVEANELELDISAVDLGNVVMGVMESMTPVLDAKFQPIEADQLDDGAGLGVDFGFLHLAVNVVGLAFHKGEAGSSLWLIDHYVVRSVATLGFAAVHHGIVEAAHVAAGHPCFGVLNDRGVEADDLQGIAVRADGRTLHHVAPPGVT